MGFFSIFLNKQPEADLNIFVRKSKLKKNKKPLVIVEVNYNSYYLTTDLNIKQIKHQPLDVLAYLLSKDSFKTENIKSISINKQVFQIEALDFAGLKKLGQKFE